MSSTFCTRRVCSCATESTIDDDLSVSVALFRKRESADSSDGSRRSGACAVDCARHRGSADAASRGARRIAPGLPGRRRRIISPRSAEPR